MATNGSKTIYPFSDTDSIALRFSWSQTSQSIPNNTTTISWTLQLITDSYGYIVSPNAKEWSVTVNGTNHNGASDISIGSNATKTIASGSTTIKHNSDGTKTFSYSFTQEFSVYHNDVYVGTKSGSGSGTLNQIKRASVLGTISNFTLGNSVTIPITKYSTSFTDNLTISLGSTTIKTVSNISNGASVSFTSSELTKIYGLLPSATSGTLIFKLSTVYSGSTLGTSSKSVKATIPSSVKPTISIVSISEANSSVPSSWRVYVKDKSKLKVVTSATAGSGSSVASVKVTVNGSTYTGTNITTNTLTNSGPLTSTITVADKRGRTTSMIQTIDVAPYATPYVTSINVIRSNSSGTADESGSYAKVSFNGGVSSVDGYNTYTFQIQYRKSDSSSWTTKTLTASTNTLNTSTVISGISTSSSYEFRAVVKDAFTTVTKNAKTLPSAFVTMDYLSGGHGVAIGKVAETEDTLDVNFDAVFRNKVTASDIESSKAMNFKASGYIFSNSEGKASTTMTEDGRLRLGVVEVPTTAQAIYCAWKDGSSHNILERNADGLTTVLGWVGSSSYATITKIRGRTCQYQDSSGTTTLSDKNLKQNFKEFSDKHDVFFDNLKPTTYQYILGSSGRSHFGYITQEVEEALESAYMTTKDFAGVNVIPLTHREIEDTDDGRKIDVEGSPDNFLLDKGINESHNLVYTEFIALNTWQIQKLKKQVVDQQAQIDELKELVRKLAKEDVS